MADKLFSINVSGTEGKTAEDVATSIRAAASGIADHIVNSKPKGGQPEQVALLDNINIDVNTGDIHIDPGPGGLGSVLGMG